MRSRDPWSAPFNSRRTFAMARRKTPMTTHRPGQRQPRQPARPGAPTAAPARSGRTPPRPCSAKARSAARIMLVGEQPGDKEDLAGKPFVGPAGKMLDRALEQAGIDRRQVYVTNAVKHFKFVPRGKFRLHQKPAYARDQGVPAVVRARAGRDQTATGRGDGRHRRRKACSARSRRSTRTAAA